MTVDADRRRAIVGTLLRSSLSVCVTLAAYFAAPLDRPLNRVTGLLFGAALLLFVLVVALQVRLILRSPWPRLQAIRTLAVGVPLLIVVFASSYCTLDTDQPGSFSEPLNKTDALYFTVTVFATVGFGDISPVTELARVLVTVQMVVGVLTAGVLAKVVFGAVQLADTRRATVTGAPPTEDR
jgi:voltage-gated potassium channel